MEQQTKVGMVDWKRAMVLTETSATVADLHCCYRLLVTMNAEEQTSFLIAIESEGEEAVESVGAELERAIGWFERIALGKVTPCGLHDVIEDFWHTEYGA